MTASFALPCTIVKRRRSIRKRHPAGAMAPAERHG
jgi:hypothetical protein